MSHVGKIFPSLEVKAINEMGDAFNLNLLKKQKMKVRRFCYSGIRFYFCLSSELHAFQALAEFEKEIYCNRSILILQKYTLHG